MTRPKTSKNKNRNKIKSKDQTKKEKTKIKPEPPQERSYTAPPIYNSFGDLPMFGFFKLNFIIYLVCVVFLIIILITPITEPSDTIHFGNEGLVSLDEHYGEIERIDNPFTRIVYHSGDRMCHMKESRSLIVNGNQMSYCARDFGIFLGFVIGAGIATFVKIDLKWWLLVIGLAPIGLDGGIQLITSYESNNVLRLFTGGLAGTVTTLALGVVVIELSQSYKGWMINRIWFKKYQNKFSIDPKKNLP